MIKSVLVFCVVFFSVIGPVSANDLSKAKKPTQEQLDEKELEAVYGVDVDRDRLGGNSTTVTTRDRYGDGQLSVFQDNTKNSRNLETNDTIGIELKLFEFGGGK